MKELISAREATVCLNNNIIEAEMITEEELDDAIDTINDYITSSLRSIIVVVWKNLLPTDRSRLAAVNLRDIVTKKLTEAGYKVKHTDTFDDSFYSTIFWGE